MRAEARAHRATIAVAGVLAAILAIQVSCVATVAATQGVALDTGRITVETPLATGKSYQLARISVRNPGTQRTRYDLVLTPVATSALSPQPTWISFSPKQVTVQAGRQQAVTVSIRVPRDAAPGRYEALVGAQIAPADDTMAIAAGAAARLTFTVAGGQSGAAEPIVSVLQVWWPVPAVALLAMGAWLGRGRIQLRWPIARRPPA